MNNPRRLRGKTSRPPELQSRTRTPEELSVHGNAHSQYVTRIDICKLRIKDPTVCETTLCGIPTPEPHGDVTVKGIMEKKIVVKKHQPAFFSPPKKQRPKENTPGTELSVG